MASCLRRLREAAPRLGPAGILLLSVLFVSVHWIQAESSFAWLRIQTQQSAELRAAQLAEAVRQQLDLSFRNADYALNRSRAAYLSDPARFAETAPRVLEVLPASADAAAAIYDEDGKLWAETAPGRFAPSIAGSPLFNQLKSDAGDRLAVGRPIAATASSGWEIPIARPMASGGSFRGAVVISVSPYYFSDEMARIGLGPNDTVGAVHIPDGDYLARNWNIAELLGKAVKPERPYLKPNAPAAGSFTAIATHEPVTRTFAWARVHGLPVVAFVGLDLKEAMASVDAQIAESRRANAIATLALFSLAVAAALLARYAVRQHMRLQEYAVFYHDIFAHNRSIKLIADAQTGEILEANQVACTFYGYDHVQILRLRLADLMAEAPQGTGGQDGEENDLASYSRADHRIASGEVRTVEIYASPLSMGGRKVVSLIVHDITERDELRRKLQESEARYRTVFETVPTGLLLLDSNSEFAAWNDAALSTLGTDVAGLKARTQELHHPDGRRVELESRPSRAALTRDFTEQLYYRTGPTGKPVWVMLNSRRLPPGPDGKPAGAIIAYWDITRMVQLESSQMISQSVFDSSAEGIMVTDRAGTILQVNKAFTTITGYGAADALGKTPRILSSGLHDTAFFHAIFESLDRKGSWEGEITNRRKDGNLYVMRSVINTVIGPDGAFSGHVAMMSDVTERKQRENAIWHRANFDTLTGLPNRALLMDRLHQALVQADRHGNRVAVLFIDLDRFKPVNDRYGHAAGDLLLSRVAQCIRSTVRQEDTVARLGGDEFVALLPVISSPDEAVLVANHILDHLSRPFELDGGITASIGACIGVALSTGSGLGADSLLKAADAAMYRAKAAGRGRVEVASAGTSAARAPVEPGA